MIKLELAFNTEKFNQFLSKTMKLTKANIDQINSAMRHVNKIIEDKLDKDFLIGHSYFISNDEKFENFNDWYSDIVEINIIPMIEEYFFDDETTVQIIRNILGDSDA